ncbi:MAG: energy transducer TonB [Candidatus Aminicenantales bacterium]|jgi:TonB family protein
MKKKAILVFILGILLFGSGLFGIEKQVYFDLRLYKAVPADGATVFIRWKTAKVDAEGPNASYFYTANVKGSDQRAEEAEIKKVFKVRELAAVAQSQHRIGFNPDMIRDKKSNDYFIGWWEGYYGIEGPLLEVTLSDGKRYDMRIIPLDVDNAPYRFKLQIHEPPFRTTEKGSQSSPGGVGASVPQVFYVDVEFSLTIGDTTIIGFADSKDTPYFLSIYLDGVGGKLDLGGNHPAGIVEILPGEAKAKQPEMVRILAPEYPESCRLKGIEGSVGLEVSVDAAGRPTDIKVVKSAHPDLDKAAVAAVKQWLFKPLLVEGKPKAAVYAMAIDFKMKDTERK